MNERHHLAHIDALRAISALLVLWIHVSETYYNLSPVTEITGRWLYDIASYWSFGRIGVITFFLISGFVVPFSVRMDKKSPVQDFLLRRFFRIYPAYWLSVPLGALTTYWIWGKEFSLQAILVNLTLLQEIFKFPSAIGLYWTLLIEVIFYSLCAFFIYRKIIDNHIILSLVNFLLIILYCLISALVKYGGYVTIFPWALLCLYLSLMVWGTLYRGYQESKIKYKPIACYYLWIVFMFYTVICPLGSLLFTTNKMNYTIPDAIGVLLFVTGTSVLRISNSFMTWLGKISYSIYLFHPVVFLALLWWLNKADIHSIWRTQHLSIYLAINVILTIIVAAVVYKFVEKPGIMLGKQIAAKLIK